MDKNRLDAILKQSREDPGALDGAEDRLEEMMGADEARITVQEDRTTATIAWRHNDE